MTTSSESAAKPESCSEHGHIRSFVRRLGRLSHAQARYLECGMPRWGVTYEPAILDPVACFGRQAPLILEIGCGMGETTAHIAAAQPHNNFLGIEVHTPGVGNLLKLIDARQLSNLRLVQHDAVVVVRDMIAPQTLAGIHVFFPDPWPKKRHHKRRLLQPPFVLELAKRLKTGGYLHCATDWEEYATQMVEVLAACPLLENSSHAADGFSPRPDYRPQTKFETRGLRLGHGVWDVLFHRKPCGAA